MSFSVVPLVILAFAAIFVLLGAWVLIKRQWLLAWLVGSCGLLLVALAVYISLFAFNLMSYQPMAVDRVAATISFRKVGPQEFSASIVSRSGEQSQVVTLHGDLWRVDARLVQWKGFFGLFGFQPGYRLDRIEGRYILLADERSKPHSQLYLHQDAIGIDVWQNAREGFSFVVESIYSQTAFTPMADGATYEVRLEGGQMTAFPINQAAKKAVYQW